MTLPKQPRLRRDWTLANQKRVPVCRICGRGDLKIELAHIIGRRADLDQVSVCEFEGHSVRVAVVLPDRVLALCQPHHVAYDQHRLDLKDALTDAEWQQAIHDAGSEGQAMRRCAPLTWRDRLGLKPLPLDRLMGRPR